MKKYIEELTEKTEGLMVQLGNTVDQEKKLILTLTYIIQENFISMAEALNEKMERKSE